MTVLEMFVLVLRCESWDVPQLGRMLFTAKINPDAFVFVLRDIPQVVPQRATCGMNDTYSSGSMMSSAAPYLWSAAHLSVNLYLSAYMFLFNYDLIL